MTDETTEVTPTSEEQTIVAEVNEESTSSEEVQATTTEESEPPEKPKKGFQKRIDELTRQKYESQQLAAEAQQREVQVLSELEELKKTQVTNTHLSSKPTLESFDHDPELYEKAMGEWAQQGIEQQRTEAQKQEQDKHAQAQALAMQSSINEKTLKATEKYPDFAMKVNTPGLPSLKQVNETAFNAMVESENMGDIAYYLANNPAEIYNFSQLNPIQAVRAMVNLENKIVKPVTTTNAPPPPSNVGGQAKVVVDMDKLSIKDWMKERNKQLGR